MAKKILVVDDAAFIRTAIHDTLKKNGYDQIAEAEDGEKAVKSFNADRPDLVITDITMPNMDGIKACKAMRKIDPNVPVIVCGASKQAYEAFGAGARDFLEKPYTAKMLLLAVGCALGDSPAAVPPGRSPGETILIVDRSDSMRAALKEIVSDIGRFEIAEAKNGKTAVERFKAHRPGAVFTEVHLSDELDGLKMCGEMGRIDGDVPVVITTFVKTAGMVDRAISAGAKDYILKPYDPDRVRRTLEAIFG